MATQEEIMAEKKTKNLYTFSKSTKHAKAQKIMNMTKEYRYIIFKILKLKKCIKSNACDTENKELYYTVLKK